LGDNGDKPLTCDVVDELRGEVYSPPPATSHYSDTTQVTTKHDLYCRKIPRGHTLYVLDVTDLSPTYPQGWLNISSTLGSL